MRNTTFITILWSSIEVSLTLFTVRISREPVWSARGHSVIENALSMRAEHALIFGFQSFACSSARRFCTCQQQPTVSMHASIHYNSPQAKDEIHREISRLLRSVHPKDIRIVASSFNPQIGYLPTKKEIVASKFLMITDYILENTSILHKHWHPLALHSPSFSRN